MARQAAKVNTAKVAAPPRAPAKVNRAPAKVNTTRVPAKQNTPTRAPARVNTPVSTPTRAPARSAAPAPTYSGGGGAAGSGDYSGGGSGFAGGADTFAAVAAQPTYEDLTIPDPLADPTYQRQAAELARARSDFDASQGLQRSQYDAQVGDSMRTMGWKDKVARFGQQALQLGAGDIGPGFDARDNSTSYGQAYEGNEGDFAGRGLFHSGMYAQAQGNLLNDFNNRRTDILTDQKNWRDTQDLNRRNFEGQQQAADQAARSDAIASIAARLGVNTDQITPGRQNVIQRLIG